MTAPSDPLTVLLDRACRGVATPTEAEQQAAAALELHEADRSNPLGPWCPTCICSWPCDTARALS